MINLLKKALTASSAITGWLIEETKTNSAQAFYVMQKKETTRLVDTTEYTVTVYKDFSDKDQDFTGSASFSLSHKLARKELDKLISEAAFAASLVKNRRYDLVTGGKKKAWNQKKFMYEPFDLLDKTAAVFFSESKQNLRFNSFEIFHTTLSVRVVSSHGVDYKKTTHRIDIEAIPSFDGKDNKVEIYRFFTYHQVDFNRFTEDAKEALHDVTLRYEAKALEHIAKADVILKDESVREFVSYLINDYSYDAVYSHRTDKKIGDPIQKDVKGELLDISLKPSSKADAFDRDGVLLAPVKVISRGVIASNFGSNQYAQYLGVKPTGSLRTIEVGPGKTSYAKMGRKPHLEIIALSGIQIDMYADYIGGEVRLAVYYDGHDFHPVSGFSFSGNISKLLSDLSLSKERVIINGYHGPKYVMLKSMDVL